MNQENTSSCPSCFQDFDESDRNGNRSKLSPCMCVLCHACSDVALEEGVCPFCDKEITSTMTFNVAEAEEDIAPPASPPPKRGGGSSNKGGESFVSGTVPRSNFGREDNLDESLVSLGLAIEDRVEENSFSLDAMKAELRRKIYSLEEQVCKIADVPLRSPPPPPMMNAPRRSLAAITKTTATKLFPSIVSNGSSHNTTKRTSRRSEERRPSLDVRDATEGLAKWSISPIAQSTHSIREMKLLSPRSRNSDLEYTPKARNAVVERERKVNDSECKIKSRQFEEKEEERRRKETIENERMAIRESKRKEKVEIEQRRVVRESQLEQQIVVYDESVQFMQKEIERLRKENETLRKENKEMIEVVSSVHSEFMKPPAQNDETLFRAKYDEASTSLIEAEREVATLRKRLRLRDAQSHANTKIFMEKVKELEDDIVQMRSSRRESDDDDSYDDDMVATAREMEGVVPEPPPPPPPIKNEVLLANIQKLDAILNGSTDVDEMSLSRRDTECNKAAKAEQGKNESRETVEVAVGEEENGQVIMTALGVETEADENDVMRSSETANEVHEEFKADVEEEAEDGDEKMPKMSDMPAGSILREGFEWVAHYHTADGEEHYVGTFRSQYEAVKAWKKKAKYYRRRLRSPSTHQQTRKVTTRKIRSPRIPSGATRNHGRRHYMEATESSRHKHDAPARSLANASHDWVHEMSLDHGRGPELVSKSPEDHNLFLSRLLSEALE